MIVCVCNRISDREIARHVQAGMDFSDIQLELGVGTCCGCCETCARELVAACGQTRRRARLTCAARCTPLRDIGASDTAAVAPALVRSAVPRPQ
jgi:bacterioferritin-associated ferredoxin